MSELQLRLHLGAHKTGTTYLQNLLEVNQGLIAASGQAYWPLAAVRTPIWQGLRETAARAQPGIKSLIKRKIAGRPAFLSALHDLGQTKRNTLISEENILGSANDCFGKCLYPDAGSRVRIVVDQFKNHETELWIAIRSYAGFISSMYAEALRHGLQVPDEAPHDAILGGGGGWPDLIERLLNHNPHARLVVWLHEGFRHTEQQIVSEFTNISYGDFRQLTEKLVRPSPSAQAVTEALRDVNSHNRPERIQRMAAAEHRFPREPGMAAFDVWGSEQKAALDEAYVRDLARIRAMGATHAVRVIE